MKVWLLQLFDDEDEPRAAMLVAADEEREVIGLAAAKLKEDGGYGRLRFGEPPEQIDGFAEDVDEFYDEFPIRVEAHGVQQVLLYWCYPR